GIDGQHDRSTFDGLEIELGLCRLEGEPAVVLSGYLLVGVHRFALSTISLTKGSASSELRATMVPLSRSAIRISSGSVAPPVAISYLRSAFAGLGISIGSPSTVSV